MRTSAKIPFKWIGAKAKAEMVQFLFDKIPYAGVYAEPFFGAGAVFFARTRSRLEVINDIDGNIVNFFRVLQKKESFDRFVSAVKYIPYAKDEYKFYLKELKKETNEIQRAVSFYVVKQLSQSGGNGWGRGIGLSINEKEIRNPAIFFEHRKEDIEFFASRLLGCQIENEPAIKMIIRYDSPNVVFYCDPPYLIESRVEKSALYANEMSEKEHHELLSVLLKCQGAVCISGYPSKLYDDMLDGWKRDSFFTTCTLSTPSQRAKNKGITVNREEVLWRNKKAMKYFEGDLFAS